MKLNLAIFVIFAIAFTTAADDDRPSKDESWGHVSLSEDRLIRRDVVIADPAFTGTAKKTYIFPSAETPPLFDNYRKITGVKVLDQYTDAHGAKATLLAGGPDAKDVTILFKSQVFRGIHSVVEVWGQ